MAEKEMKPEGKKNQGKEGGKGEGEGKKEKLKLAAIHTSFADDGTAVHHHEYHDKHGNHAKHTLGGTSSSIEDLHRHMDDHAGPMMAQAQPGETPDGDEGDEEEEPAPGGAPAPVQG